MKQLKYKPSQHSHRNLSKILYSCHHLILEQSRRFYKKLDIKKLIKTNTKKWQAQYKNLI